MKVITGDTPNTFITTIRMKNAALLLKNSDYNVSEISNLIGYNDTAFFSRTFKKYYNVRPKPYSIRVNLNEL